ARPPRRSEPGVEGRLLGCWHRDASSRPSAAVAGSASPRRTFGSRRSSSTDEPLTLADPFGGRVVPAACLAAQLVAQAKRFEGVGDPPLSLQGVAQVAVRHGEVVPEADGLLEGILSASLGRP